MPVFNAGEYLERAIASVRAQTLPDFELILVDDGSTDGAVDRARRVQDSRIRFLSQSNEGAPVALNRALAVASGEYIAILDADDLWAPNKLERHLEYFQAHPDADLTFTGIVFVGTDDAPLNLPERRPTGRFTFEQLFVDYVIGSSSAIAFRKTAAQLAGSFDPTMLYIYDTDFVLRIARIRPDNIVGIPEPLTLYRRHPRQQTSDWRPMAEYWAKLLERHRLPDTSDAARLMRRAKLNANRYFSYLSYEQGDLPRALSFLGTAFVTAPFRFASDVRNWKLAMACGSATIFPKRMHQWLERLGGGGIGRRDSRLERVQRRYT